MTNAFKTLTVVALLAPTFVIAHPGHGSAALESTPLHILEPQHAVIPVALIAVAFAAYLLKKSSPRR